VREKPVFNGRLTVLPPGHPSWTWPLTWPGARPPLLGIGKPSLIFVGDMADLFHERRDVGVIDQVVATVANSPHGHIGQLLTKRADVMAAYFAAQSATQSAATRQRWKRRLWLGFSAENQEWFDRRWAHARALAADGFTVFVSVAPMIGAIRLPPDFRAYGDRVQVICSGERMAKTPRYLDPNWARRLRDQCAGARVAFFMKQCSGGCASHPTPIPDDLQIQQFPAWEPR
jgi:protein gp37